MTASPIRIEAVLPLTLADLDRFRILDRSLDRFFPGLSCWVVTPDRDHSRVSSAVTGSRYRVLPESAIVPERSWYRKTRPWFIQQLIKLAAPEFVEADFYITLDADLICIREVRIDELFKEGRAITNVTPEDWHPEWYAWAERVLGLRRSGVAHGVTPVVYSVAGMRLMHRHLEARTSRWRRAFATVAGRGSRIHDHLAGWRSYLLRSTPWTEQSLYFTFLEANGLFDRYHHYGGVDSIYSGSRSLWYGADIERFDAEAVFTSPDESFFIVVQSNTGIPADIVWNKVRHFLDGG